MGVNARRYHTVLNDDDKMGATLSCIIFPHEVAYPARALSSQSEPLIRREVSVGRERFSVRVFRCVLECPNGNLILPPPNAS